MDLRSLKIVRSITNLAYILVSTILFLIAFVIIIWSIWQIGVDFLNASPSDKAELLYKIMDEVGLIIFSIAVADVAKYLLVEEVLQDKEQKSPAEKGKALSNLIVIITTAFSLEGLILTIQVAKTKLENLVYPILLLVVAALMLIALSVYKKLSSSRV